MVKEDTRGASNTAGMVLDATRSVRGTVGMVLEATGGSQGLPDGINVNKRGLRDSEGGLRGYVKFPWYYQRGIRGLWRGICNYSGGIKLFKRKN